MKILEIKQLSEEWFEAHLGLCTASHAADLMRRDLKPYANYLAKKAAEILTGQIANDRPPTFEMQWGIDHEAEARREYSEREGILIEQVGFVIGSEENTGCSPDGFVGDKGIVQFKCPSTATHLKWMLSGVIPEEHLPQIRFEIMVCEDRQWNQLVSYDPRLPKRYQIWKAPLLLREDAKIPEMRVIADQFREDLHALLAKIDEVAPELPAPDPEDFGDTGLTEEDFNLLPK